MFKKLLLSLTLIGSLVFFTSSQMSDNGKAGRTDSPGENNCTTGCHSTYTLNSGSGSVSIQSAGTPGFKYTPGQTYNMSVTVAQAGIGLFGVGIEALIASGDNAGTLNITDLASTAIKTSSAVIPFVRRNIVQTLNGGQSQNSKVFNFSWTAPAAGTGDVTFYFAGVAANGNGTKIGDWVYTGLQLFTEDCAAPAQPANVTGNISVCSGSTETYSVAPVAGATSYTWTLPSGWTGTSTTESISVVAGSTAGDITVTANNVCGSSPVTALTINVNAQPVPVISLSGSTTLTSTPAVSYQWYFQGSPMSGWNNMTCMPMQSGDYSVEVTDANGCVGTSAAFTFTGVGIGEINHANVLSVYPNPASGQLSVHATEDLINTEFTLFNMTGGVVLKTILADTENMIDLSAISEGVYFATAGGINNKHITRITISR